MKVRTILVALVALLAAAAPAHAARPLVTKVSSPPELFQQGETFTMSGRVSNPARKAASVQLRFNLRGDGVKSTIGFSRVYKVPGHKSRPFSADLSVTGLNLPYSAKGYAVRACVRGARRRSCKAGKHRAFVPAPDGVATATPTEVPVSPTPTVLPTTTPTATASTSATATTTATATSTSTATSTATATASAGTPGTRTLNDTLFPDIGNGGYDALHYDLDLSYIPTTLTLSGTATTTIKTTQNLSEFSFDFGAPTLSVSNVTIDGVAATSSRDSTHNKLIITPATAIPNGSTVKVAVTYAGVVSPITDTDGSIEGWVGDPVFGAIVVSEPVGAMSWFPSNNVPFDKASYTLKMAVPNDPTGLNPWEVVATGKQSVAPVVSGLMKTFTWDEPEPTSSYLFGLAIGHLDVSTTTPAPTGTVNTVSTPFTTAIEKTTVGKAGILTKLNKTPGIQDYYADYYGVAYPFNSMGGIVPAQNVLYSLEVQTKPIYAVGGDPGITTVAHENAHMYFGDYLTLTQWKDIWCNEGMTEFSSWLWDTNKNGGDSLAKRYADHYTNNPAGSFWDIAPANPADSSEIFDSNAMYVRGATTMLNVHEIMGDADFRDMMHSYLTSAGHPYANTTTADFIAQVKASDLADQQRDGGPDRTARWTEFFKQWLYTGARPSMNKDNFDTFAL